MLLRFYLSGMSIMKAFSLLPIRLSRFLLHFMQWVPTLRTKHLPSKDLKEWSLDLVFYTIDIVMIPDALELVYTIFNPNIRLLNQEELRYVDKYFKSKVNTSNVRMSPNMPAFFNSITLAFVAFNTIHFNSRISVPIFIHEMVHIWQFQKFGSVYIYRALKAQKSKEGYDYGGLENLYSKMLSNFTFTDFNFEQQGEIFEDYCRMMEEEQALNPLAFASYEYFIGQVREGQVA